MNDNRADIEVFKCYYTDASRSDRLCLWGYCAIMVIVLTLIPNHGNIYPFLICGLIFILIPLWFEFMVHMIRTRSSIELSDKIVVRRWMCRPGTFPTDKIESIRIVDFDKDQVDKLTQDYRLPMPMGRVDLYPKKGVIVFFDRKWIKSVQPIFFNAADPEKFAMALAAKSNKPVSAQSLQKDTDPR